MVCRKCQGITAKGIPCSRYASCRIGCKHFCWQHADNYVDKVGCPRKRTSSKKKTSSKGRKKPASRQKGILKPPRTKSKKKKSVRFKPKRSLVKIYPVPYAEPKKKTRKAKPKAKKK